MDAQIVVDGRGRSPQRLSHDLATVEPSPRILGALANIGIRAVIFQFEQSATAHRIRQYRVQSWPQETKVGDMARRGPKEVTPEHKAAMAAGRAEGKIVRDYLETLQASRPKRGRKRTPETIRKRLTAIESELATAETVDRLKLLSERTHLNAELMTMDAGIDISSMEAEFIKIAAKYSERNSITYHAWREMGVSAQTLRDAGVRRTP